MGFLDTFRSVDRRPAASRAPTAAAVRADDLRFIADVHEQVENIFNAYRAGRLSLTDDLATALSQTKGQLLAIRLDESVDPMLADRRGVACARIMEMVGEGSSTAAYPAPAGEVGGPTETLSRAEADRLMAPGDAYPARHWATEPASPPAMDAPPAQTSEATARPPTGFQRVDYRTDMPFASSGGAYASAQSWPTHQSPGSGSRGPSRRMLITIGMVILAIVGITGGFMIGSGGTRPGWIDHSLRVVGSPVAADGVVVVLDVSANRQLQLTAVNPKNGATLWTRPFSASQITSGVAFGPTVIGDTVLVLSPTAGSGDPSVTVEGLDVATGNVMWVVPQPVVISDAPAICGGEFCVAAYDSDTTTALVLLDPATGAVVAATHGPNRNMAVSKPGSSNTGGLWQTSNPDATFEQVSAAGQDLWSKSVASVFGGKQYDPSYGWDFLTQGRLDVGSVNMAPSGTSYPLDGLKTVGISISDGTTIWSDNGYFMCGGGLQFLTVDVICKYTGTATQDGTSVAMRGVGVTLEGLDPASGTIRWSLPVQGAQSLSLGTDVAFADGTHLVVTRLSGQRALLDVTTGTLTPLSKNEVFWCEKSPTYKVRTAQGASAGGQRQSSPVFDACSGDGQPVHKLPSSTPSTVGALAEGMYVWPTSNGLRAESQAG